MTTIRVISNGFGEDLIACKIIDAFDLNVVTFDAFPLVGQGNEYKKRQINLKLQQTVLPSGGFLLKIKDIIRDLRHGLASQFFYQRQVILDHKADYQLVVGDIYALYLASKSSASIIFLPTAKTERAIPHWGIEFSFIRKHCDMVFPRDTETHQKMLQKGISSYFFGNPMFDDMASTCPKPRLFTIGILPGSRDEGLLNLALILRVLSQLKLNKQCLFKVALPPHFSDEQLISLTNDLSWMFMNNGQERFFINNTFKVIVSNQFFDVLQESSLIIGLAGTANEQAMFTKRPVVSFIGCGPQSSQKRFKQQALLIDGAQHIFIDSNNPIKIAKKLSDIINNQLFEWYPLSDFSQNISREIKNCIALKFKLSSD